jgi:uncharacterized protein
MALSLNKEIFEMKLSVIAGCVLRCDYCFVDKSRIKEAMSLGTAQKAVDFLVNSKGKDKIIKIYGGEPLLNFDVVKKIVPYAKKYAKKKKKNLTLSICTNAVLLKPQHLDFLKKNKFQLAISFDGKKKTHDRFRKFSDGRGTFSQITRNFKDLFKIFDKKDMAANMSITPSESKNIIDNFSYILSVGFDTINLEPVYGFQKWSAKNFQDFKNAMEFISRKILSEIPQKNYIFLTTVNRELKYETLSKLKKGVCLFHQFPEVYPDGSLGFSSFFLNFPEDVRNNYVIGNVTTGKIKREYKNCVFSVGNRRCRKCLENYFNIPDGSMSSKIVEMRNIFSVDLARRIERGAKDNPVFRNYIQEAKKHICF